MKNYLRLRDSADRPRSKRHLLVVGLASLMLVSLWVLLFLVVHWCSSCNSNSKPSTRAPYDENLGGNGVTNLENDRAANASMKQVCYYAIPRNGADNILAVRNVDPNLCTHLVISSAKIQNNTIIPSAEEDVKLYGELMSLKKQNPDLCILLCIGNGLATLVTDPNAVAIFAFNAHQFLITHGFDGLDLDWEFPAWPPWQKDWRERKRFTHLVLQLNNALKLASHPPLMLTIAVGAPQTIVDSSYEVSELAKYVDYVSIMGYDYHMFQSYMPFTGHNAPLSKGLGEVGFLGNLNIQWATNYWVKKGMPKEKLVVGIPTYGRTWKLLSNDWYGVGAPAVGIGMLGGYITYTEACIFIKEGATRHFDRFSQVPYSVRDRDWVSFEDPQSIRAKAQWIKDTGVAGVMTWSLNSDDWAGLCSGKKYELHNLIKGIIRNQ